MTTDQKEGEIRSMPLKMLFCEDCRYLFTTERNMRQFEWDAEEQGAALIDNIIANNGDEELNLGGVILTLKTLSNEEQEEIGCCGKMYHVSTRIALFLFDLLVVA